MEYFKFDIEKQDNSNNQPNDISVSSVAALTVVSFFGHVAANYFSGFNRRLTQFPSSNNYYLI